LVVSRCDLKRKLSLGAGPLPSVSSARGPGHQPVRISTERNGKRAELIALARLLGRHAARELPSRGR
jgi:hypothetical protein